MDSVVRAICWTQGERRLGVAVATTLRVISAAALVALAAWCAAPAGLI